MKTRGLASSSFFDRSMLTTRLAMPSWIAASPMPGASYMVSNMSSTSLLMPESIFWIGSDFSRSLLSGILMISRIAMIGDVSGEQWGVNVERFCRRSIAPSAASGYDRSLSVLSAIRQANAKSKRQKGRFMIERWPALPPALTSPEAATTALIAGCDLGGLALIALAVLL